MTDKFTKAARGRPCTFRAPGCDGGGDTTILAHVRKPAICGMGIKPPSVIGFWSCAPCHDLYDRRRRLDGYGLFELNQLAFDAMCRTLYQLCKEELIT